MSEPQTDPVFHDITCPFCGLACDDLAVRVGSDGLQVAGTDCALSLQRFAQAAPQPGVAAQIAGRTVSTEQAVAHAAALLRESRLPLIGGLATDVTGMRAALALADDCGAVVDHMASAGLFRNLAVLQDSGWITTTLTELRNRADLVLVLGTGPLQRFPRLAERCLAPKAAARWRPLFLESPAQRELVLLGPWEGVPVPVQLEALSPQRIHTHLERLGEVAGLLRAILADLPLQVEALDDIPMATLRALAAALVRARYAVVLWAAGEWDFPQAELALQGWTELIQALNRTTRCSALPLGGTDGDLTAHQVCTWQAGLPLRSTFHRGHPEYDPHLYAGQRLLHEGEVDTLLWVAGFDPEHGPPETDIPTIVLGHPGLRFRRPPQVFIPTGIPGIDHRGEIFRADAVVSLPLRRLRQGLLPSAAQTLGRIASQLRHG
jgi:formylmethanofuran dehydrogenase subunit B